MHPMKNWHFSKEVCNMDQQTKGKFIVVVMIGIVLAAIIVNNLLGGGKNKDSDFDKVEGESTVHEVHLDSKPKIEDTEETEHQEIQEEEAKEKVVNFEEQYIEAHGEGALQEVKGKTKKVMELWVSGDIDEGKWSPFSSPDFLREVMEVGITDIPDGVTQELQSIEVFSVPSEYDNEIKMEASVSWNVKKEDWVIREEIGVFYLTFSYSPEQNGWVVKEFVQT